MVAALIACYCSGHAIDIINKKIIDHPQFEQLNESVYGINLDTDAELFNPNPFEY